MWRAPDERPALFLPLDKFPQTGYHNHRRALHIKAVSP